MTDRKPKRESEGMIDLNSEKLGFVLEPTEIEVGSGYAISVSYDDDDHPIVDVKTYGVVDIAKLRKDIERVYPKAHIRNLTDTSSVAIVKKQKGKRKTRRK